MTICRRLIVRSMTHSKHRVVFGITGPERWVSGDGPFRLNCRSQLPTGLALNIDYWVIREGGLPPEEILLATSKENALAGVAVAITALGDDTVPLWIIIP